MSSLYKDLDTKPKYVPPIAAESWNVDDDFVILRNTVQAYASASMVVESVATESLTFIQPNNRVLFNAYTSLLSETYGVVTPRLVSPLAFESSSVAVVNHQLALEGWMGDLWAKIKSIFTKIYTSITEFFKKHFTRLGIVKKRLNNLIEALNETDKDAQPGKMMDVDMPTGLGNRYKGFDDVSAITVGTSVKNMDAWMTSFKKITDEAKTFAKAGMVGPDFIRSIKELRDKAANASTAIDKNKEAQNEIGTLAGMVGAGKAAKKALKDSQKDLTTIKNNADREANQKDAEISNSTKGESDDETLNSEKGTKLFEVFVTNVSAELSKHKGKLFVDGFQFKEVTGDKEKGLEIESENISDTPEKLILGNKAQLKALCTECLAIVKTAEAGVDSYSAVNEEIMKQLTAVDTLVKDIDKFDPEKYGKYRKVLTSQVQTRLKLLQTFFRNYNQIGKNVYSAALSTGEGVVEFSMISMKHFG